MIKVRSGIVVISEQTLREIIKAVELRKETPIDETPMPVYNGVDVETSTIEEAEYDRGKILIKSHHSGTQFKVILEKPSQGEKSESLGYRLSPPIGRIKFK